MSNIKNRTIYCKDNLDILREIDSNCVDMIYLDPPFNSKKQWHAPVGSHAEGASFKDIFGSDDVDPAWMLQWGKERPELYHFIKSMYIYADVSDASYIQYMAIRIIECHRILKDTGSLAFHCDHVMNDYVKIMLDIIFGRGHDINNLVWTYGLGGSSPRTYSKKHDNIFLYAKTDKYYFKKPQVPATSNMMKGKMKGMADVWTDIPSLNNMAKERTGYPTQKPLKLLRRIIESTCPENGLVIDPFCGCATTCVAAEQLGRQWVGIDVSIKAYELVKDRLAVDAASDLFTPREIYFQTNPPKRNKTDDREIKYVYIISNPSLEGFKVGIAANAEKRLNSYQTGDPNRGYILEYKIATPDYLEIEKSVHDHFDNDHEWVQAELNEIKKYIKTKL